MNPALPVLFRCEPRHIQLTKAKCAEDYYVANGGAVGDEQKAAAAALKSTCARCPVGAKHREELAGATVAGGRFVGDVGVIPTPERAPAAEKALAKARREEERLAREKSERRRPSSSVVVPLRPSPPSGATRETPKEIEMEKLICINPECEKTFKPATSRQQACSKECGQRWQYLKRENGGKPIRNGTDAATPPKAAKIVAPKARPSSSSSTSSPLVRYLELLNQVDRLLVEFPEIEDDAKRIRELVGARSDS